MILVVDDEAENRESLKEALERESWEVLCAANAADALELLRKEARIRLLITDLKMPGSMNGLELLQNARLIRPDVARLLITAFGSIEDTVLAMKAGAFDVLTKPVKLRQLKEHIAKLLKSAPPLAQAQIPLGSQQISSSYSRVLDTLRRASMSEANVLFTGESGSGKSYLARSLHKLSRRRAAPFVALNCASIPHELLESELFGFEKGAFTGAGQARDGKILAASGGSLLLDEIGDLSPALQAKLLQFIQDKRFFKLGSNKEISADVRILSATHRPLTELVSEGKFREDLLYRLRVVEIAIPPLRHRKEDLFWLVPILLDQLCEKNGLPPVRLRQDAFALLFAFDWPGNIRELENVLESSLVLANREDIQEGLLGSHALPEDFMSKVADKPISATAFSVKDLATLEREAMSQALLLTQGNKRLAAQLLGISERTLYRLLGSHAL